ncbi:MAG: hypothetical protein KJ061_18315, partial [Vicinamibacteraceae bacterium]|nr:hypothetical protein [Vicinamibacteraceae bacterium]
GDERAQQIDNVLVHRPPSGWQPLTTPLERAQDSASGSLVSTGASGPDCEVSDEARVARLRP